MVSRKKKHCLLVMGLCGVALIVDRLTPTNSSTVPAAAQAAPTRPIVNTAAEGLPLIPKLPFPRSLRTWDRSSDIRDFFLPPQVESNATGDGQSPRKTPGGETSSKTDDETNRQSFASRHALHAVMVSGSLRIAIVDGTWVREGERFDGCELERISNNQALFSCYAGHVTLVSGITDLPFPEK
ncbi:MAG: hypothetical protein IH897_07730 [Planctomycetes bacterium]|nr:hypothetical protein [Planctomycetota bacterium]